MNVPEVSTETSARASRGRGFFLETLESTIRSMEQMPASKRARVEEDVGEVVRGLRTEDVLEMGKNISGYKLYMLGQNEQLLRAGFSEDLLEEECLEKWEELSHVEKKAYNEQKKSILEKFDDASQRQLDVKARQEEKERKEKGPGWYYVLEPVKPKKVEEPKVLLGIFLSSCCCVVCEEAAGDQVQGSMWGSLPTCMLEHGQWHGHGGRVLQVHPVPAQQAQVFPV